MYVPVTYVDQAIPSPSGMPAYEEFDCSNPAAFFFNLNDTKTVSTPKFSGKQVASYQRWTKLANFVLRG